MIKSIRHSKEGTQIIRYSSEELAVFLPIKEENLKLSEKQVQDTRAREEEEKRRQEILNILIDRELAKTETLR